MASPQHWPPRSPHEVLASTPKGRERLRRMAEEPPSPSPLRKRQAVSDNDDEEDEETLQLKLQAIEARLKLKQLQRKQNKGGAGPPGAENASRHHAASSRDALAASRAQSRAAALREVPGARPSSQTDLEVPASPVRRTQTAQEQRSPSRVLFGIDKGLRAQDVSLKRAPIRRKPDDNDGNGQGGYLRRARTPAPGLDSSSSQEPPKSFSERLAAARTDEASRKDRQERIKQLRNKAFDVKQQDVEHYKETATEIPDIPLPAESFSREEVMAGGQLRRSNTAPVVRKGATGSSELDSSAPPSNPSASMSKRKTAPAEVPEGEATSFEPFSSTHLSKRIIPHNVLTRTLSGKKTLLIKDLLRDVKYPDFELPDVEQDVVVMGILASKSDPKTHQKAGRQNVHEKKGRFDKEEERGKYMVLTLVDLKYQVDLFLFDTAFTRYWKMTPGTLVAILNPTIMPPPKGRESTGRFSLVINSDCDTVLEIGAARDLGFCKSLKKNGELCNSWVNKKRTEFCEFHMNTALDRKRLARQEINSGAGIGPSKKQSTSNDKSQRDWKRDETDRRKGNYDAYTHSHFFISKASPAALMDDNVQPGQVGERVERGDALRRRLAAQEKERKIMDQLGKTGRGAGREYMKHREQQKAAASAPAAAAATAEDASSSQKVVARSLGLLAPKGSQIRLSPIKRKRNNSSFDALTTTTTSSSSATAGPKQDPTGGFGWGGGLKTKLDRMKDGEKLDGSSAASQAAKAAEQAAREEQQAAAAAKAGAGQPPPRKKTRFVTAKGIREAGRDSLGGGAAELRRDDGVLSLGDLDEDDDDDELVILR